MTKEDLAHRERQDRLPTVDATQVVRGILTISLDLIAQCGVIISYFKEELSTEIKAAIIRLPRLCHAVHYVLSQFDINDPRKQVSGLLGPANDLRGRGFHWLDVLVSLGLVDSNRAANIRAGQGHLDTARDLQAITDEIRPHWAIIGPLQAVQPDQDLRIDEDDLNRMALVGTQLIAALDASDDVKLWYGELVGAMAYLKQTYELAERAWLFHNRTLGRSDPPSFFSLGRTKTKASTSSSEVVETPPDAPTEPVE
jgi:hypothetical protein